MDENESGRGAVLKALEDLLNCWPIQAFDPQHAHKILEARIEYENGGAAGFGPNSCAQTTRAVAAARAVLVTEREGARPSSKP